MSDQDSSPQPHDPAPAHQPTTVVRPVSPPPPFEPLSPKEPATSKRQLFRSYRLQLAYLFALLLLLAALVTGWAVFLTRNRPSGDDGSVLLVADAGFLFCLLVALFLFLRQSYFLLHLFHLLPTPGDSAESDTAGIPPWLLPRPPPYPGTREVATGDVEDGQVAAAAEGLPRYGENRGSKLLLRSESRGGAVIAGQDGGEDEEDVVGEEGLQDREAARMALKGGRGSRAG